MNRPRVLLTIDLSWAIYRAAAAHPQLSSTDGTFTGGVYGFIQSLQKAIRETGATHVVACTDSKPYRRSVQYPEYKQLRKSAADPELKRMYDESEPLVRALLVMVGVPVCGVPGFEADDIAAHLHRRNRSRFQKLFANANDSDLYQLLEIDHFACYKESIQTIVTAATLKKKMGLTPAEFMLASALQGTHNDIEGIPGVGPIKSKNAVLDPSEMRKYRESHGHIIDRNLSLITLPHPEFPAGLGLPQRTGRFNQRTLYRWLARLDIDTQLPMVNAFEQIDQT